jgi:hypothetical protein
MDNREKLIKHLENLQKRGKQQATIDIPLLLSALRQTPVQEKERPKPQPDGPNASDPVEIIMDGGTF